MTGKVREGVEDGRKELGVRVDRKDDRRSLDGRKEFRLTGKVREAVEEGRKEFRVTGKVKEGVEDRNEIRMTGKVRGGV